MEKSEKVGRAQLTNWGKRGERLVIDLQIHKVQSGRNGVIRVAGENKAENTIISE